MKDSKARARTNEPELTQRSVSQRITRMTSVKTKIEIESNFVIIPNNLSFTNKSITNILFILFVSPLIQVTVHKVSLRQGKGDDVITGRRPQCPVATGCDDNVLFSVRSGAIGHRCRLSACG